MDTVALGLVAEPLRWGNWAWYLDIKEYTDFYRDGGSLVVSEDYFAEMGIRLHGDRASIGAFLRFEHFAETLVEPWRQEGDYLSIGLRVE
jgi:hypothetical protein